MTIFIHFRVSPSLPTLKKMQASIDACVSKKEILSKYKDPHLYSSLIKHYLRELPEPLLCSSLVDDWRSVDSMKDHLEKKMCIKELLEKVPNANKNNISYIFRFVSKLVAEERYNKMSIENIIVVLSPNLLWDSSGVHVPVESVYKSMIENLEFFFDSQDFDYDEIDSFDTEISPTLKENPDEALTFEKRSSCARSAIRQNRKRYQNRSSSDTFILSSMESGFHESTEYLNLINQTEDEEEISTRKASRKISKSWNDETYRTLMANKVMMANSGRSYSTVDHKRFNEEDGISLLSFESLQCSPDSLDKKDADVKSSGDDTISQVEENASSNGSHSDFRFSLAVKPTITQML